ncbi:MAG: hypothetical protein AMXMBFR25_01580 [Lysobacterales bacterium]
MSSFRFTLEVLGAHAVPVRRVYLGVGRHRIGSEAGNDWVLPVDGVSRQHAEIEVLGDGGVLIVDLGSTNGTRVAGRRVTRVAVGAASACQFGPVEALLAPVAEASAQLALALRPVSTAQWSGGDAAAATTHAQTLAKRLSATLVDASTEPAATRGSRLLAELAQALAQPGLRVQRGDCVLLATGAADCPETLASRGALALLGSNPGAEAARPWLEVALALLASDVDAAPAAPPADPAALPQSRCPALLECYRQAGRVARSSLPLLLLGESGSGKEVLARWIHAASPRRDGPFVAINCAALPADLMEAELFGVEKGAATGVAARPGVIEQAHRGSLFLDELGEMAPATQAKLLRALESTQLFRVGGREPVAIDVRFIAATHQALDARIAAGEFRLDLYHRLAAAELRLPPLRERLDDLPALAGSLFREALVARGIASPGITAAALAALAEYAWPGNIRELRNEIQRAAWLLEPGEPLDRVHLSPRLQAAAADSPDLSLDRAVAAAERSALLRALELAGDDLERALALLGVSRTSFYRKLREHGLARAGE